MQTATLKQRLRNELKVLRANLVCFALFCFLTFYMLITPTKNFPFYMYDRRGEIPIRDASFEILPLFKANIQDYPQMMIWPAAFVFLFFLPMGVPLFHQNGIFGIANFLTAMQCLAMMFIIRIISFSVTIIPDSSFGCRSGEFSGPKSLYGNQRAPFLDLPSSGRRSPAA